MSGVPQVKGKVLFIFICWLYKDYNDRERAAMIFYHLTIQIQPPRRQCCKPKLRWWLKRDQWAQCGKLEVDFQWGTCSGNMMVCFTNLLSTSLTLLPKALCHLWLLLLSCLKPSAVKSMLRLPSSVQNCPTSLKPTCFPPQWWFFLLPLYNHIAILFTWLLLFHQCIIKPPCPLTGLQLGACFSSMLSSGSFAPPVQVTLPGNFSFCSSNVL